MRDIIKILNNIGLNKNQAKAYLTMLTLGKTTVLNIAKESKIARTTLYDNINTLKELGLASEENGKKYFKAESPENILKIVETKKCVIEKIIPVLLKMYKTSKLTPKIVIMNGKKGLIKMHQSSLFCKSKRTRFLGEVESLFSYLSENFVKNYIKKRVERGIRNQVLTSSKILNRKEMYSKEKNKENLREIKYLENIGNIDTSIFNFDEYIYIISSSKEGFIIMIESKEFSETFSSIFDFLWKIGRAV